MCCIINITIISNNLVIILLNYKKKENGGTLIMKKTNKVISLVLALVMALSILVVIPTASATSTVRINEVNANVGYSIVYNIYLQTDEKANTMEGRLNYDNKVLDLTSLSFDNANSFASDSSVKNDMTQVNFKGKNSVYDCKSSRMTVLTAVFKVINTSDKYTSATTADAVSGCFTKLIGETGTDLMKHINTNITTRTIIGATSLKMAKTSVLLDNGKGDSEVVKVKAVGPVNNDVDSSYAATYTSSNTKVVKVSGRGTQVKITAVGPGKAEVRCTTDGNLATAKIKVTVKQPVKSVKFNKPSVTLKKKGAKANIKATVNPTNASVKKLTVKSENTKVVKVNKSKVNSGATIAVTAVKKGKTFVRATATDGSKKFARIAVKVKK